MIGGQIGQLTDAGHNVGQLAKGVFQFLWGVVGHFGKGAEGSYVDEGLAVDAADVQRERLAVGGTDHGGFGDAGGDAQIMGAVIGGPGGDIAQYRGMGQVEQAGYRFAQSAVTPGAHHPVKTAAQLLNCAGGIALALGGIGRDQPARLREAVDDGGKLLLELAFSRALVIDEKQSLHDGPPSRFC